MSHDVLSVGAKLGYGASPTNLLDIIDFPGFDISGTDVETTDYDITDKFKTFIAGNFDPGEISVTVKYGLSQFSSIYDQLGTKQKWTIEINDGQGGTNSTFECQGYLRDIGLAGEDASDDGLVTNELTIKLSGKPTFTEGST